MVELNGVCAIVPREQEGFRPRVFGMGVLVNDHELVTCGHVIDAAVGEGWLSQPGDAVVTVCFPFAHGMSCVDGTVDRKRYFPPGQSEEGRLTDIAVVRLNRQAPTSIGRAVLQGHVNDGVVKIYGFRRKKLHSGGWESHPDGEIVESKVLGSLPGGRVYFEGLRDSGATVEPGFSGAGVYDPRQRSFVGMVVQASVETERNDAQFIDAASMTKALGYRSAASATTDALPRFRQGLIETSQQETASCIRLRQVSPSAAVKVIESGARLVTIGRAPKSVVHVSDEEVSWEHGQIMLMREGYFFRHVSETNPSVLRRCGQEYLLREGGLREMLLRNQDRLTIGSTTFVIEFDLKSEDTGYTTTAKKNER